MKYTTQEGFNWEIVSKEKAIALLQAGAEVYKVYDDESESLIDLEDELSDEFILEEAYQEEEEGYYYYTEWDVEDEEYWYEEQPDGTLIEINK